MKSTTFTAPALTCLYGAQGWPDWGPDLRNPEVPDLDDDPNEFYGRWLKTLKRTNTFTTTYSYGAADAMKSLPFTTAAMKTPPSTTAAMESSSSTTTMLR